MVMKGKMRSKGGGRRRIQSKYEESDASDDEYKIEDDGEFEDSEEYCSSLAGEELADDLVEDEKEEKVMMTSRLKRRNAFPSTSRGHVGKASKRRSYKEDSDDDYVDGDDDLDEEEDCTDWRTGFPKRKRNGVQKAVKKKKASYMEENADEESEHNNDDDEAEDDYDDDYNENEDDEDLQISFPSTKQNGIKKLARKKKSAYTEESDDDYKAEDDANDDEDYSDNEDDVDLRKGCPSRKQNEVYKSLEKKKASYKEESDDDYEAEDDDEDYNEDEEDLHNYCPSTKQNGAQKSLKKKNASYIEEEDNYYEAKDDECDDDDEYMDNADDKNLRNGCPSRKQNVVKKDLKKKKASSMEENDDDYEAEDDDCNDDDDYDNEEDEEEVEEEDDEDFTPNEIDFDDEDEFAIVKKAKKVKGAPSQGRCFSRGRKRKRNSRVISNPKRKKPAKRHGFNIESSSLRRKETTKGKSTMKETNEKNSGRKRRRLVVDSESDFAGSEPLLLGQDYTISEEEREQVREAGKFCGRLDVTLQNSSSKKRSREEGIMHRESKHKTRKGKDKIKNLKNEAAKQVCGICFSEEGKRTVRGALDCCSHYFCFNCIMEWSKVESRCPLCKQRFATISKPTGIDTVCDLRTIVVAVPERDQVYQPSEEELRAYIDPYENVICAECHHGGDDANMLLCDLCDSPAHTYCVGLSEVPEGSWYCEGCRPTALSPSNPQALNFTRNRRTTNDIPARSSPFENVRETIDLNRVYEPETPLAEGTGMLSSPRPVDGDLRAGSSIPGAGVQTVSDRRRRHQQIAHFAGRTGVRLGPEVEWGRTGRLGSQNAIRPETSLFQNTFSQGLLHDNEWRTGRLGFQNAVRPETSSFQNTFSRGLLHDNFPSPLPIMRPLPATPSHPTIHRFWGQTLAGVNGSADGSGSLQSGFTGITGGDGWSFHGHSQMQ